MIGDGALRPQLERLAGERVPGRVIWTGFLNNGEDVAGLYAQCDLMLLPSGHEPWGVVVVEAAAAGLALLVSDNVGAAPELVHDGVNGATFANGDVEAMTRALLELTAERVIDERKARSRDVVANWLDTCEPVMNFRAALQHCGVISADRQSDDAFDRSAWENAEVHMERSLLEFTSTPHP
jgi:glycosyltransferase involved in cell wall biosynthesis